jgi:steroid delta-isomerase-like uncharacterized protein
MSQSTMVVRRYLEDVLGGGQLDLLDEVVASEYVDHTARPGRSPGPAGVREVVELFHTAFPDLVVRVEETISEQDRVATRFTIRGTHSGPFAGLPATHRRVMIGGIAMSRVANGRIVEQWDQADMLELLQQFGALPSPCDHRS